MAGRDGYIGRAPGDSSGIIARQQYTASGVTTDFTFTSGYTIGYIDAYLNGIRLLEGSDYTAGDGNSVGLTTAAVANDVLELVAYKAFNLANPISNASGGSLTVGKKLTVSGISSLTDVVSSGIVTADSFYGDGSNLTGLPGQRDFWTKTAAGINTTVSVGIGTTRPDSIARSNNTKILNVGIITAYQLYGDGSNLSGISTAAVPGISTQLHSVFGTVNISGIATANEFRGDGSQLTGVGGETDITSCLFI